MSGERPSDDLDAGGLLLLHRAHRGAPRDSDRGPPRVGREAAHLALGRLRGAPVVRKAGDRISRLPGDVYSPVLARPAVLRWLLGTRGRPARDVLLPHRDLGLSLVRMQPAFRRGPVPPGPDLVVPGLDARRAPGVFRGGRALPWRRARARPLDGRVGGSSSTLGAHLRRAARPDDRGHRADTQIAAADRSPVSRDPRRSEGQAQIAGDVYREASQRRSLRPGPPRSARDASPPSLASLKRTPWCPAPIFGSSSASPAWSARAASPIISPISPSSPRGALPPQST